MFYFFHKKGGLRIRKIVVAEGVNMNGGKLGKGCGKVRKGFG